MPSPIAHLGAGYAIYRYYRSGLPQDRAMLLKLPFQMIIVMGLSLLPDLDIVAAIMFHDMENYHNSFSHSIIVAVPVALLIAAALHQIYSSGFWLWFFMCLISYDIHVIMDVLTSPRGVMMFWPFSANRFVSPVRIFYGLQWDLGWFSISHLWTLLTESVFVMVLVAVVNYFDKRKTNTVGCKASE